LPKALLRPGRALSVVTLSEMRKALLQTLGRKGMSDEHVDKIARYIMAYFGFTDHVVDNRLSAAERDIFYMLEEEGLLSTYQEEVPLRRGKTWRLHYWTMRKERIKELASMQDGEAKAKTGGDVSVYDNPELWELGKTAKKEEGE
jgi:hypothetical protein